MVIRGNNMKRKIYLRLLGCIGAVLLLLHGFVPIHAEEIQISASAILENEDETDEPETDYGVPKGILYTMVFYDQGFFGYGEEGDFKAGSFAHFVPILLAAAALVLIYKKRNAIRNWKYEENFRFVYIFIMLMWEMSYFWRLLYVGPADPTRHTLLTKLPLQICQWTLISCVFMMAKKSEELFHLDFFLVLSFSPLAMLVPAVISNCGPRYFRYYQYWGEHLMPVVGMFYMMFVHGMRPKFRGVIYLAIMLAIMAFPGIYLNNTIREAHFFYLKPGDFSMLSFLPNSPGLLAVLYLSAAFLLCVIEYSIYRLIVKRTEGKTHNE